MEENKQPEQTTQAEPAAKKTPVTPPAKKAQESGNTGKIIAIACAAVLLCAVIVVCTYMITKSIVGNKADPATEPGDPATVEPADTEGDTEDPEDTNVSSGVSYAYTDANLAEKYNAQIVATVGDNEMNGAMFQIFFWSTVYNYLNQNADYVQYLGPDTTKSLADQDYGDGVTWEQHFVESALELYLQNIALYIEGTNAGTEIDETAKANIENLESDLTAQATEYGFDDVNKYLEQSFGPNVTVADYKEYYQISAMAYAQADVIQAGIDVTDEEAEAYYDENADSYAENGVQKVDKNVVNVRHILIQPEKDVDSDTSDDDLTPDASSDDAWAAAKQSAEEIYATWKLDPTEDNFGKLATSSSQDTGSTDNGGLYENVYPGQMVETFSDWCFDDARKPGDTEIIKTDYGYHIMYFSSVGDTVYWREQAKADCVYEKFDAQLEEIFAKYSLKANYDNVHVYDIIVVNNAADAEATDAEATDNTTAE